MGLLYQAYAYLSFQNHEATRSTSVSFLNGTLVKRKITPSPPSPFLPPPPHPSPRKGEGYPKLLVEAGIIIAITPEESKLHISID